METACLSALRRAGYILEPGAHYESKMPFR
jgi:hypothetical protein